MKHIAIVLRAGLACLIVGASSLANACVGCGQGSSFTPTLFFVGLGFVLLPASFVAFIAYRIWKDSKENRRD